MTVADAYEGVPGTLTEEPVKQSFGPPTSDVLPSVCATTGPVDPIAVNIEFENQGTTVTIHNTFAEPGPQPAPPGGRPTRVHRLNPFRAAPGAANSLERVTPTARQPVTT